MCPVRMVLWGVLIQTVLLHRDLCPTFLGGNRQCFYILLFGKALRCPYKRLVNYKFLLYNENTLRYIYAKLEEKLQKTLG